MTIYGRKITQEDMDNIASYMDDEIREELHAELAPCEPEEFLKRYIEEDSDFLEILQNEFDFVGDEKVYWKVYAQCITVPKRINRISEKEAFEIIRNESFENEDYEASVKWNWELEDPEDELGGYTQESCDSFYSHVTERLEQIFDEFGYIDCGDYRIVVTDEYTEPRVPNACELSMASYI